jgi:hypothetical protein
MDDLIPKLNITSLEEADTILVWQDIQSYFRDLSDLTKYFIFRPSIQDVS